jgi:FHS family glucose/mannose:H+ symporter-like MFS transporter
MSPARESPGASLRHSVAAVYLTSLAVGAVGVTFPASSTVLRARLDMGDTLYGAYFVPGLALAILTALLGPRLLRRWSLKALFRFGLVSQAVTLLLMALGPALPRTPGLAVLMLAMVVSGPGGGALGIALNTAAVEIFPRTRGTALAALHGLLGAGAALWPVSVAAATRLGFWAGAPLALAAIVLAFALVTGRRPTVGLADDLRREHGQFHLSPRLLLRAAGGVIYGAGEATFTAWVVVFLRESRGLSLATSAGALSAFWLAMAAGRVAAAIVVRRAAALPVALCLSAGMSASFLLVARCGAGDALWRFAFAGLSCSALFPLLLALASQESPERTPQVSSIFSAAGMTGVVIGAFGVGPLRGALGLEEIYRYSALGPLLLGLLLVALARRRCPDV